MSKLNNGIAALVLVTVLSAGGYAAARGGGGHGGGGHGGGGHGGGGHFHGGGGHAHFGGGGGRHFGGHAHFGGGGRHFGGRSASHSFGRPAFSHNRAFAVHNFRSSALNSRALARTMRNPGALQNPGVRARIAAGAALAGWHGSHGGNGWWRHGNGGYGWVGPLFWPFAYFDIYDYAIWGNGFGASFWGYGYDDIYAGMFAPYGYDNLARYLPPRTAPAASEATPDRLAQMCGDDSREIAGLPIDLIQQVIEPTDTQRTALDELANVSVTAAQNIKAACPTTISLTAPNRLASMQQRIEAMIAAVALVQPALDKFYGLLNDEQKARFTALGEDQRRQIAARRHDRPLVESCGAQSAAMQWPAIEIDARLHPTDAQRASLTALQDASAKAAEMLKTSCQSDDAVTPPARLAAVGKRLDTMLQAIKLVGSALDDFYATLSDEQKAQFEAIGPRRTASADQSYMTRRHYRRYGF